jgi:hypothetical protein
MVYSAVYLRSSCYLLVAHDSPFGNPVGLGDKRLVGLCSELNTFSIGEEKIALYGYFQ